MTDGGTTVLITGGKMTKALQLARSFHAAGHRVILVESAKYRWTGHRFSRAVDTFYTVPEPSDPAYARTLVDIVRRESVDVFVPVSSPAASINGIKIAAGQAWEPAKPPTGLVEVISDTADCVVVSIEV